MDESEPKDNYFWLVVMVVAALLFVLGNAYRLAHTTDKEAGVHAKKQVLS